MTSQGDNSIVYTTQNGEKVAIPPGNAPSIGDKVLVHRLPDGTLAIHGNSSINVGDTVLVTRTRTGEYIAVKGGVTSSNCVKVTDDFYRDGADNEVVDLGTFEYTWDGSGRVVIYPDCAVPFAESMWVDDTLQVSTENGSLSRFYGGPAWGHPALTLNTILKEGKNEIDIKIINGSGKIGCPTLYITHWNQNPPYPG